MSLKIKLVLFIVLFAFLPVALLEGYQGMVHYKAQIVHSQKSLKEELRLQKDIFIRFFDGVCRDIEFISGMPEVKKLIAGFEDEDFDEIEYWKDSLTAVLMSFSHNRKVFKDIFFTIIEESRTIIRVSYENERAVKTETRDLSIEFKDIFAKKQAAAEWIQRDKELMLWFHYPVKNRSMTGIFSIWIDLSYFYQICNDKEIYFFSDKGFPVINAGTPGYQSDSPGTNLQFPENNKFDSITTWITDDYFFSYSTFAPIRWIPDDFFTICKIRSKSLVTSEIRNNIIAGSIGILFIFLSLMFCQIFFLNKLIFTPLNTVSDIAERLSDLDLTANIETGRKDEIGKLLQGVKNMLENLGGVIAPVFETVSQVQSSADEIAGNVNKQAVIAAQQSSSVSEIMSTMKEFSLSSVQIAEHSKSVAEIADNTLDIINEGVLSLDVVKEKMEKIDKDNLNNIIEIKSLGKKTDEISNIINMINNISSQTILIAFNAAIEASAAGDAGKRFSVVASEIRRLADNVTESVSEIEKKINDIQEAVMNMTVTSETSTRGIMEGMKAFSRTVNLLDEILAGARLTADSAKQISISTSQQKTATDQIVAALKEIADGTGQTSVSIRDISLTASNLKILSDNLQNIMKHFKLSNNQIDKNS